MVREETLRALVSAKETMSRSMRQAAKGTRDLRDSMSQTIASGSGLVGVMDASEHQVEEYERAIAGLGRESVQAAAEQEFLAQGALHVGSKALRAATKMEVYERSVDRAGDEAAETAVENLGLAASLQSVAAAAGEASVNVGPFNTSVRRAAVALPAVIALVGSFTTVLLGMATAALAAGGALMALFAGGLIGRAEEMARHSADIENTMEALKEIFLNLKDAILQVTEPIRELGMQDAAMALLEGMVVIIGDLADSAARLMSVFGEVNDRLGATFWAEEARGMAEVEKMIKDLMPLLEDLTFYILTKLPDLFAWLREETLRVGPALGDFFTSALSVARALSEIGGTILRLTLPALSLVLDATTLIIDAFNAIPDPVVAAAAAFAITATVLITYAGAATAATAATALLDKTIMALAAKLGVIAAPLSATVVIIAAVVAAIIGLISYFNLWDDITSVLVATWNGLVEVVEFIINGIIILTKAVFDFIMSILKGIPIIGDLIRWLGGLDKWIKVIGDAVDWLGDKWDAFVKKVMKWIGPIVEAISGFMDQVDEAGGVELDAAKIENPSSESRGGPETDRTDEEAQATADRGASADAQRTTDEIRETHEENNFDFSGASFGSGMSERDIERAVERALAHKNSTSSDT